MAYILIISIATIITVSLNILFNPFNMYFYFYIIAILSYIAIVVIIDAIVAAIVRALPEKWFNPNKKIFVLTKREKRIYERIGIKKWKDYVPDLGRFTNFQKGKIENPRSNEYLSRYMIEACYGIIIHYVSSPLSYLILLINYKNTGVWLTVGLPVAFVNSILILLPAFTLKYNLHKIKILYKRNERQLPKA